MLGNCIHGSQARMTVGIRLLTASSICCSTLAITAACMGLKSGRPRESCAPPLDYNRSQYGSSLQRPPLGTKADHQKSAIPELRSIFLEPSLKLMQCAHIMDCWENTVLAQYFIFIRASDGWGILHRDDCRFVVSRTEPHPSTGQWLGPYRSRMEAIVAADRLQYRPRPCRFCNPLKFE
jgi:hypothetical protein